MTDLVNRLRTENSMMGYYDSPAIQIEAADEIERLRAREARLREALREAGEMLEWSARRLKDNSGSNADISALHLAANRTAEARAALGEEKK